MRHMIVTLFDLSSTCSSSTTSLRRLFNRILADLSGSGSVESNDNVMSERRRGGEIKLLGIESYLTYY